MRKNDPALKYDHVLVIGILILVGLAFRLYNLSAKELHFDEKASIGCAVGIPYAGIMQVGSSTWQTLGLSADEFTPNDFWKFDTIENVHRSTLQDNGSILYFSMLHYWVRWFGPSTSSFRLLSVCFGILAIITLYLLAYELFASQQLAFFSSLLLCIHPLHISSSQFARSHSMTCFLTILATLFFVKLIREQGLKYIILYAVTCALAMISHYFASYIIFGHVIYILLFHRSKPVIFHFGISGTIAIILFSVWMTNGGFEGLRLLEKVNLQFRYLADHWKEGDNPYYIPFSLRSLSGGIFQILLATSGNWLQHLGFRISEIAIFGILFWGIILYALTINKVNRTQIYFICVMLIAYFIWAVVISYLSNFIIYFQPLYALYIVPFVCMLLGVVLTQLWHERRWKWFYSLLAFQLPLWMASIFGCYSTTLKDGNYYHRLAEEIKTSQNQPNAIFAHESWEQAFLVNLSLKGNNSIHQKILMPDKP